MVSLPGFVDKMLITVRKPAYNSWDKLGIMWINSKGHSNGVAF
jgi:hypothetical protein